MDCKYCSSEFETEDEYLSHLQSAHTREEVSGIDEKKVDNQLGGFKTDDSELPTEKILLGVGGVLLVAILGVIAYTVMSVPTGGDEYDWIEKEPYGQAHYHGQITVTITGETIDFSQSKYQVQDDEFHFEAGNGQTWHGHANRITLQYALATLDMKAYPDKFIFNGKTYTEENYNISYIVNGNPVNVSEYILKQGDTVRVKITKA